jgi:hypothetical protein
MAGAGCACVAFDDVVVALVDEALPGKLAPAPPIPTVKAIMVAPPNSETVFVALDFMRFMRSVMLHRVVMVVDFVSLPARRLNTGHGFWRAELGEWIAVSVRSTERLR